MKKQTTPGRKHTARLAPKLIRTILLIVSAASILFFGFAAAALFSQSRSREIDNQRSQLAQIAGQIRSLQSTIRNLASLIVYNDVVQSGISNRSGNIGEELYAARRISSTLTEYLHIVDGTEEITIYTTDGQTLTSRYVRGTMNPVETDWFRAFAATGKTSGFSDVHTSVPMQSGYTTDVISYITGYYSIGHERSKLGELIINVEHNTFLNIARIDTTLLKGYALFSDSGERLVSNGDMPGSREEILAGMEGSLYKQAGRRIFVASDAMEDGWVLVSEISGSALLRRSLYAIAPLFIALAVLLPILGLLLSHMIRRVTDPVNELSEAVATLGQGDFSVSVDIHTQDEVEDLAKAFNRMVVDMRNLMDTSVEHEKKIHQMETENLLLQINPHFIYNTMNSIVYMARMEGNNQLADFTNAFISLLQSTLRVHSSVYTTLEEELKNVRSYLTLQSYRYDNKFTCEIDCPQELTGCRIVSVMLQPVVENAIFHGIAPKDGPGSIWIRVSRVESGPDLPVSREESRPDLSVSREQSRPDLPGPLLRITVQDDGVGMSQETLSLLLSESYEQKGGVHKIGLGNVQARIREVYGPPYGMKIASEPGVGTTVTIEIPYEPGTAQAEPDAGLKPAGSEKV